MNRVCPKTAVLHVALNPLTGPWAVMKQLVRSQAETGLLCGVALGLITDASWPPQYEKEAKALGLRIFRKKTPKMFGTASALWQFFFPPGIDRWVETLARETGADQVIVHFHNAWLSGIFVPIRTRGDFAVQVTVTFHGVNSTFLNQPIRGFVHRWMAQRLTKNGVSLVSCDHHNTFLARDVFSISPERFTVIHNGAAKTQSRACPILHNETTITVGHVGSISERKGWRIAMEAVDLLNSSGTPARLLIAGLGPESEMASTCAQQRPGTMEYLGHVTDPVELLMPRLDVLSLMSMHEGLPMTLIEAMSVGLPVIATAVGGIPEAIVDGKTGFLIPRTAQAMAGTIEFLYRNPDRLREMSGASLRHFVENFEIEAISKRYLEVYGVITQQNSVQSK